MADSKAGEAVTANYGWTKPDVMGSDDQWGGYLNADLDGIDSIVHGIDTRAIPPGGAIVSATPPGSPTPGMLWFDSVGGQSYVWYDDGSTQQWVVAVNAVASLSPATTTTLGGVKVDGTSIKAAGDGTISTVLVPMGDNRIINGDMRIDQRNNGASGTATGYTVDRWAYYGTVAAKGSWSRYTPSGLPSFPYCLNFTSSSAYTPLTADNFSFFQPVEADMVSDFAWGGANAQPVTLSFWAFSSLTGMFSGVIRNAAASRAYPFTYSIPTANTWTRIVVAIPGDTSGTWTLSGNGQGVVVIFDLGSGAVYRGPAGVWAPNGYCGATGTVSVVGTNGATFYVTGVKLEIGSVATPYNRQSLAKSMADCQRYYSFLQTLIVSGYNASGGLIYGSTVFPVSMRAAPTAVYSGVAYGNASNLGSGGGSSTAIYSSATMTATAMGYAVYSIALSAEL